MIYGLESGIWALDRKLVQDVQAMSEADISRAREASAKAAETVGDPGGSIAVLNVRGVIMLNEDHWMMDVFGGTSVDGLRSRGRQAMADPSVRGILLNVFSPGGSVFGLTELHAEIMDWRKAKPVVAFTQAALSGGYWIASAAHEIVCPPSGLCGSIGVYTEHVDTSEAEKEAGVKREIISAGEHKADGVDGAPLSDEGRAAKQRLVDYQYGLFTGDIAAGRGIERSAVVENFGKGLVFSAPDALAAGMVDKVGTVEAAFKKLATPQGRAALMKAAIDEPPAYDGEAERRLLEMRVRG
jgi:signal peptide peptidase SppA